MTLDWISDDEVLAKVAQTACEMARELDERHEALAGCLQKLAPRDRELVLTRYEPGSGVAEAAKRSGRSMDAAYKALNRLMNFCFDVRTHRPVRNFLFLDSVVASFAEP
mgnify:CR=1 FL=1